MNLYDQKGELDRQWYLRKLNQAIKAKLPELITQEAVMGSAPDQRIRIAVRKLEEPDFRYQPPTGQGQGKGTGPGNDGGEDVVWIELTTEEIMDLLLDDLKLPRLEDKPRGVLHGEEDRYDDVTTHGPWANIDKRRSLYEAAKAGRDYLQEDDLRYRSWKTYPKPITSAVITLVRDASGSMDESKRYLSKSAAWWLVQWIRRQYQHAEIRYFLHTTTPVAVDEKDFFNREITGGTAILSTYQTILQLWDDEFPHDDWNRYLLHFSDGDIWSDYGRELIETIQAILATSSILGYFEVEGHKGVSPLWSLFRKSAEYQGHFHPAMRMAKIDHKDHILPAIRMVIDEKNRLQ
ncbi:DUF444 family protein [Sulfobacillus sp. hq2]|uniref:DUF444 family protein n=1 Tax=Sulfobacillus thermotolerans TaxID=338644 RepID=A0ABN5H760_9FIRM|nr:DUF444 family protein [Sulfobacillus sp. hq2]AUW95088.1 hypothetical protein BXT84_14935 [Sulfobacillus thermotolerans]